MNQCVLCATLVQLEPSTFGTVGRWDEPKQFAGVCPATPAVANSPDLSAGSDQRQGVISQTIQAGMERDRGSVATDGCMDANGCPTDGANSNYE